MATLFALFFTLCNGNLAHAWQENSPGCLQNTDLLDYRVDAEELPTPCWSEGYLFGMGVWGEGFVLAHPLASSDIQETRDVIQAFDGGGGYYQNIRYYLLIESMDLEDVSSESRFSLLLAALLSIGDRNQRRFDIYRGWIVRQFIQIPSVDASFAIEPLLGFARAYGASAQLETIQEYNCFVRSDIHNVAPERVLESVMFRSCMESIAQ
ncbi:hypothetical protein [Nioella sp. MMSF_3534]|uniref:hypothetical protein n=1 Tax=Nioella sp. MMSF_3534 TaxID=3046720 RepID=UPI00273EDABE|nr:hypothetical protein [Nioella sp. MMSF_3534]